MRIAILTAVFHPELHPRAFRAYELAKEYAKQGHKVEVFLLTRIQGFDYEQLSKELDIKITLFPLYTRELGAQNVFQQTNPILRWVHWGYRWLLEYFLAGNLFAYSTRIAEHLKQTMKEKDMVIALSTPFMNLYGLAKYVHQLPNNTEKKTVYIADSGDPFYYSQQTKRALYFKWIEKWVYRHFDYLSIPTSDAIPAYAPLIPIEKIKIIPQAFNMRDVHLAPTPTDNIPTFAYAGVFYQDIRNPEFLFKHLCTLTEDFRFHVYLRHRDPHITSILNKYQQQLGEKLIIHYSVERTELLYRLSECHFLINISNTTSTQLPSKLIDYGITRRPVYSFDKQSFKPQVFDAFMHSDYTHAMILDTRPYNIEVVTKQFLDLH
jgi:glycosyltransferase involved in cell wall biosynthesis